MCPPPPTPSNRCTLFQIILHTMLIILSDGPHLILCIVIPESAAIYKLNFYQLLWSRLFIAVATRTADLISINSFLFVHITS